MHKNEIEKKHYSLGFIFSLFILMLASIVIILTFNTNKEKSLKEKIKDVGYGNIETINPLFIEQSARVENKADNNISLINEIKRVYNLDVIYGEGTEQLCKSIGATAIYEQKDVNNILMDIINSLEKYPNNIFKEMQIEDYDIEICIVDCFNNDNIALATRDSNNNFRIYLSNDEKEENIIRSIHHETYHILEYYMKLEFDLKKLYKDWNSNNPEDFVYQEDMSKLDKNYVYELDDQGRWYFVSVYSKFSDKEDRAEVFADTMLAEEKPAYYSDNLGAIKNKVSLIVNAIEQSFYSVSYGTSIYWTRFL